MSKNGKRVKGILLKALEEKNPALLKMWEHYLKCLNGPTLNPSR